MAIFATIAARMPRRAQNSNGQSTKDRLWSFVFVIIILATLCFFLVGQGANSATSVYLDRIGGSTTLAGIGALTFSFAAAISRIVVGPLIDARGRAILMVAGAAIMLIGCIGPLFSNSDIAFLVWRIFQGCGFALGTTASATAAADVLPQSRLGEGIGYYGLGQAIAMSLGPALAIFLVSTDPPENFYFGLIACSLFALLFSLACRYEKNPLSLPKTADYRMRWEAGRVGRVEGGRNEPSADPSGKGMRTGDGMPPKHKSAVFKLVDSIFEPNALSGAIPMVFIAASFGFGIFFVGVLGGYLDVAIPGMFYTVAAISMIAIRLTSGKFMDKVPPIYIMGAAVVSGLIAFSIFLYCIAASSDSLPFNEWIFYSAGIFYGISLGVALPINQTIAVKLSPPERWGAANGLFLLANDISIGIASMAWGQIIEAQGFGVAVIAVMAMIALSFIAAMFTYPKSRKSHNINFTKQ